LQKEKINFLHISLAAASIYLGVMLLVRTFFLSARILDISQSRFQGIVFLASKMDDLMLQAAQENGLRVSAKQQEIKINRHPGFFGTEISTLEAPDMDVGKDVNQVTLFLNWKVGNLEDIETVATYVKNKK
jgi:hypothetical protein